MSFYNTSTTATTANFGNVAVVQIRLAPPPKPPEIVWIERTAGITVSAPWPPPHEIARVCRCLEALGYSPENPFDRTKAKRSYLALAKEHHPDVGGDAERFKEIAAAWDDLKKRGFVE